MKLIRQIYSGGFCWLAVLTFLSMLSNHSMLSYFLPYIENLNFCSITLAGSITVLAFAVLAAMRGELYSDEKPPTYAMVNRVISGGGTTLVILALSTAFSMCLADSLGFDATFVQYAIVITGVIGSLAGPIRGTF